MELVFFDKEPCVEIKTEKEGKTNSEISEKEKELEDTEGDVFHSLASKLNLAVRISSIDLSNHSLFGKTTDSKLYIQYHRLRIVCYTSSIKNPPLWVHSLPQYRGINHLFLLKKIKDEHLFYY